MNYDPVLKKALSEIEEVCKKYDCSGYVSLHSKTHGEFKLILQDWCLVRIIKNAWHVKLHIKSKPEETTATVGFLYSLQDELGRMYLNIDEAKKVIEKNAVVEHQNHYHHEDHP